MILAGFLSYDCTIHSNYSNYSFIFCVCWFNYIST